MFILGLIIGLVVGFCLGHEAYKAALKQWYQEQNKENRFACSDWVNATIVDKTNIISSSGTSPDNGVVA